VSDYLVLLEGEDVERDGCKHNSRKLTGFTEQAEDAAINHIKNCVEPYDESFQKVVEGYMVYVQCLITGRWSKWHVGVEYNPTFTATRK